MDSGISMIAIVLAVFFVFSIIAYILFMIFLPEWVGITGKKAREIMAAHLEAEAKDKASSGEDGR